MAQRLSNLKVGETVKFGKRWGKRTRMVITDKAHTGFPTNSVQLTNLYCDDTLGTLEAGKKANLIITRPIPSLAFMSYSHQTPIIERVLIR